LGAVLAHLLRSQVLVRPGTAEVAFRGPRSGKFARVTVFTGRGAGIEKLSRIAGRACHGTGHSIVVAIVACGRPKDAAVGAFKAIFAGISQRPFSCGSSMLAGRTRLASGILLARLHTVFTGRAIRAVRATFIVGELTSLAIFAG
jgi:hypothetical protein